MAVGTALMFIKHAGVWNNGIFTVDGVAITNMGNTFTRGANTFMVNYDYVNGADRGVALIVVVPEPAGAALAVFGLAALGLRRRRTL